MNCRNIIRYWLNYDFMLIFDEKNPQITGLGTFLVVSVLWVISCFEQNSMFRKLNVLLSFWRRENPIIPPERALNDQSMIVTRKHVGWFPRVDINPFLQKKSVLHFSKWWGSLTKWSTFFKFQIYDCYNVLSLQLQNFGDSTVRFPGRRFYIPQSSQFIWFPAI